MLSLVSKYSYGSRNTPPLLTPLMHRCLPSLLYAHMERTCLSYHTYEAAELLETKQTAQNSCPKEPATKLVYSNKKKLQPHVITRLPSHQDPLLKEPSRG